MKIVMMTFLFAFVLLIGAVICLGIGYLITGKSKLTKRCGRNPKECGCKNKSRCEDEPIDFKK